MDGIMNLKDMGMERALDSMRQIRLYHILYADELRLDSLEAQINNRVPVRFVQDQEDSTEERSGGEAGVATILKAGTETKTSTRKTLSMEYAIRDSRYFDVLEKSGIDLTIAEDFSPSIVDGKIHVLNGALKISGASVMAPFFSAMETLLPQIKRNPELFGLNEGTSEQKRDKTKKNLQKEIGNVENMIKILSKLPMPPAFRLDTQTGQTISGPIDEKAVRMNMGNMMLLFRGKLPFTWKVIGYLYPLDTAESHTSASENNSPIEYFESALAGMGQFFLPSADAIMIPLLIMR